MADSTPDHQSIDLSGIINLPIATEDQDGLVELADAAETQAGVDDTQAVTPAAAAATYVALSEFDEKGDLLVAAGASTPVAIPVGPDGAILTACSLTDSGVAWEVPPAPEPPAIPCSVITGKGNLVAGSDTAIPVALPVGANGQVLTANSACPTGLEWKEVQGGSASVSAIANAGVVALTMDNLRVCFNSSGNRTWSFSTVSGTSTAIAQVTTASDTALSTQRRVTNLNPSTFCELGGNFVCAASCATYLICMGPLNNPHAIYCFVGMTGCNYCNNLFSLTRLF